MQIRLYRPPSKEQAFKILFVLWMAGTVFLIVLSLIPLPPDFANARFFGIFPMDKVLHTMLFALLTAVPVLLFRSWGRTGLAVVALLILCVTTEYLQIFNATRNASFEDVAANLVGCGTGLFCGLLLRLFTPHRFPLEAPRR